MRTDESINVSTCGYIVISGRHQQDEGLLEGHGLEDIFINIVRRMRKEAVLNPLQEPGAP